MLSRIKVGPAPHIKAAYSTRRIMLDVMIALVPAVAMSVVYFRVRAAVLIAVCVLACAATEWLCNRIRRRPDSLHDGSAMLTGLILALSLPPALPVWAAALGSAFAIAIGKMVFGGLGSNIFNPAMAGRLFLTASFGTLMTTWTVPGTLGPVQTGPDQTAHMPPVAAANTLPQSPELQAVTQATPLAWSKEAIKGKSPVDTANRMIRPALVGQVGGCLGETSALALLVGGVYLLIRRTITFHIPLAVLGSALLCAALGWLLKPEAYANPLLHLAGGGLLLGAFFIATDPVTAPLRHRGMVLFGVGVGVLTMLIRMVGEYPEGVMFAVFLMNAVTPLIDRLCKMTPFGGAPRG